MDIQQQLMDRVTATITKQPVDLPFEPTIEAFKQWEEDLPILNPHVCAEMLSTAAQAILCANISAVDKFKLAEEAKHCLLRLYTVCKQEIENATFPLRKKQADNSSLLLNALTNCEHIYSDLIISKDYLSSQTTKDGELVPLFSDSEKSLIIFRSFEVLSAIQLLMSLIYRLPKPAFWNTVNALYECAESFNLHQLQHLKFDHENLSTIEDEFKKIHFFHLALPNRFKQNDIESIQAILTNQANDILISKADDQSSEFYIDLSSSSPAAHRASLPASNEMTRFFNNESLVQFMLSNNAVAHETSGAVARETGQATLPKKVIHMLLPSWKSGHVRNAERHQHTGDITIYPGFESIIRALILKQNPDIYKKEKTVKTTPFSVRDTEFELTPIEHDHREHHIRFDDTDANRMLKASSEKDAMSNSIWGKKHATKPGEKGQQVNASINDSSLKGMRFTVSAESKPLLKTTDLVGIHNDLQPTQLAIIRSINNLDDGCVSVGVEMMSPNLKVASIKSHDENIASKPAIFLQGIPAIKQEDAIISPYRVNNHEADIVLKTNHQKSYYSIDKTIESNQVFTHYTVSKKTNVD